MTRKLKIKPILQGEVQELRGVQDDASLPPEQKEAKAKQIHRSQQVENWRNPDTGTKG